MLNSGVLFIDDNFICNTETCYFLRESGLNTVSVYCASAAFEVINRHERLSALVTDIDLGPGVDGFDVARHARAGYPDLSVVYIQRRMAASGHRKCRSLPIHQQAIPSPPDRGGAGSRNAS
ncbi:hypothetical protein [Phenylobacterium sp.]|jgi:CheY-like chemotaxis protein|uniref:hypothetical protein n=1 Tax=Phenylobacterium sp. TaxID=1871053 RepID=UPI002F4129E5